MRSEERIPVRDERAPPADLPGYPARHRGRRLLGVDAYGLAHYRAADWVEVVRRVAFVHDDAGRDHDHRAADGRDGDGRADGRRAAGGRSDGGDGGRSARDRAGAGRIDARDEDGPAVGNSADEGDDPRVESDLVTVHQIPLHLAGVSLDEYLRDVGSYLEPVAGLGFEPVEDGDPDRWEWVSPYARRWVEAFGDGEYGDEEFDDDAGSGTEA